MKIFLIGLGFILLTVPSSARVVEGNPFRFREKPFDPNVSFRQQAYAKTAFATMEKPFRRCYRQRYSRTYRLKDKAKFIVEVGNGSAQRVKFRHSRLNNKDVNDCITREIKALRFPPTMSGEIQVQTDFNWRKQMFFIESIFRN